MPHPTLPNPIRGDRPGRFFVAALLPLLVVSCSVPALDEQGKQCTTTCPSGLPCVGGVCGGTGDASPSLDATIVADGGPGSDAMLAKDGTATGADACSRQVADPCNVIPRFEGTQVVDGLGTDFCGIPMLLWNPATGVIDSADPTPPSPPLSIQVQVAWSDAGVHVFVQVPKWPPAPAPPGGLIYLGDAVEVFLAASSADITGQGDDPGTLHVIASPPALGDVDAGGQCAIYPTNAKGNPAPTAYLPPSEFASRLVAGEGFNIELEIPWSAFPASAPSAGSYAGFDIGVDLGLPLADGGTHDFQSFFYAKPPSAPNNVCDSLDPQPACNDRTWCIAVLD